MGLEKTFEEYITKLCDIFDEVKRVLRNDGTCWVNLGDTYAGGGGWTGVPDDWKSVSTGSKQPRFDHNKKKTGIPAKSLCLIPQRFAIEMVNRGWILRNTIIWHKPNCMPSSAKDRFTVDFEYLYFFSKSNKTQFWTNSKTGDCVRKQPLGIKGIEGIDWEWKEVGNNYSNSDTKIDKEIAEKLSSPRARKYREVKRKKVSLWAGHDYWFEQQLEKYAPASDVRYRQKLRVGKTYNSKQPYKENLPYHSIKRRSDDKDGLCIGGNNQGRNKRAVWTITTKPFKEAHFATFPEDLIATPIKAGCPKYVCKKCGKARVKIYEKGELISSSPDIPMVKKPRSEPQNKLIKQDLPKDPYGSLPKRELKEIGYTDCGCNAGFEGGVVLDPFMGAGTTAVVAKKQGKRYIGIEIKQEYIDMANKRIRAIPATLF